MGQNKFYTDLDSLLMPVHGAWCKLAAELDVAKKGLYNLAHIMFPHTSNHLQSILLGTQRPLFTHTHKNKALASDTTKP